jgi:hypothetical protein
MNTLFKRRNTMKTSPTLRLLAISLMTGFLLAGVPPVQATVFGDNGTSFWQKEKEKEKEKERERERSRRDDKDKKPTRVPEGGGRALLILAAGALGGGVLVWRKRRADVS